MVHQHHPFPSGAQQMIAGQNAHYLFMLVQNGIAGMAIFQHHFPDIVHPVVQVEANQTLCVADTAHRGGLKDQSGSSVGVKGCSDDTGLRGKIPKFHGQLRLAQHQTADIPFQSPADHIRLVTAQNNALLFLEQQILIALGQGNGYLSGHGVRVLSCFIENLSLQHG